MTLNQIINRLKLISLSHKQVRNFYAGLPSDFLNNHTTLYPSIFVQDKGGNIGLQQRSITFDYRMFFVDLVNVSQDAKTNEQDVQSDMVSVALDIVAQINNPAYTDWKISISNTLQLLVEEGSDMYAGVYVDFSISAIYTQNICDLPSNLVIDIPENSTDMKIVYDIKYTAIGNEGKTISIPEIVGKKVLFITRENGVIYKVSNNPDPAEYKWNDLIITLGVDANPMERFLILYRNY